MESVEKMNYLQVIAEIWKSGAEMKLLDTGEIELLHADRVPVETMNAAELVFDEIEAWFKSWTSATAIEKTMRNILLQYCGWTRNTKILKWLNAEESKTFLVHDWTVALAQNGWTNIYDDYRQFENDESHKLAKEIYNNACEYMRKVEG